MSVLSRCSIGQSGSRGLACTKNARKLTTLSKPLKDEQRDLLLAAEQNTIPSASTIQRVAMLELNIAAIENTLADEK
ncbi:MAG: hypothetical protein EOR46_08190 [Mesorhizobium sp.]|nr:MAG: hypothetical protein EOR46_08190 [Mesorhizobium sp.]RWK68183.1 MAG: hypothetical protein EOR54_15280 [Mesorhizobium sp.]RWK76235.1 MAG: hypothetical protein EOR50_14655 [Mesorhizobium sp.]RWK81051.1 MAG: hypothetical protein EOR51_16525 [Mesorhizobium sp.]RWL08372.1 MAG: hypothetical protein EOR55_04240 [Mesorhizobium sp.]